MPSIPFATQVSARFLRHHSAAVRAAAVEFTVEAAAALSPAELYAHALPALLPALRCEPVSLRDASALVACLEPGALPLCARRSGQCCLVLSCAHEQSL